MSTAPKTGAVGRDLNLAILRLQHNLQRLSQGHDPEFLVLGLDHLQLAGPQIHLGPSESADLPRPHTGLHRRHDDAPAYPGSSASKGSNSSSSRTKLAKVTCPMSGAHAD